MSDDHPPAGPPGDHTPYVRAWAEGRRAAEVADQSARLQAMLDATAEDNDRLRADRDRLSAELAEARRLLRRVVEWYDGCGISSSLFVALEPTLNEALAHLSVKAPGEAAPVSVPPGSCGHFTHATVPVHGSVGRVDGKDGSGISHWELCDAAPASVSDRPAETVPELLEQMRGTAPPPEVAAAREAHERRQREPLPNHRIGEVEDSRGGIWQALPNSDVSDWAAVPAPTETRTEAGQADPVVRLVGDATSELGRNSTGRIRFRQRPFRCEAEMCRNWTGQGCACEFLDLEPDVVRDYDYDDDACERYPEGQR